MSCDECRNEDRLEELEHERIRNGDRHKEFNERLSILERSSAARDVEYNSIMEGLKELKNDIKDLKDKPAKRWESLMELVMQWAVLGLLAATMIFK